MFDTIYKALDASSAKVASGNGASLDTRNFRHLLVEIIVSAVSGTSPTMLIKVQGSNDGVVWFDLPKLEQTHTTTIVTASITAIGNYAFQFDAHCRYIRLYWTLGGTSPSFTFLTKVFGKQTP